MTTARSAGNEALERRLAARLAAGEAGHAYLLSGPEGSGRHALADYLAAAMVCTAAGTKPCRACAACRKAAAGSHPDVRRVVPEEGKQTISVRQIRQTRADAYVRPNEAARKVYVIEDADRLNAAGQNALLKVLEDGPEYAAFLLIARNAGQLLPTVRSRCEILSLTLPEGAAPEEGEDAALAAQVTDRWLAGDEGGLSALCVTMEKMEPARFSALMETMTHLLGRRPPEERGRVTRLAALLDDLRKDAAVNVGVGNLAGRLCAEAGNDKT